MNFIKGVFESARYGTLRLIIPFMVALDEIVCYADPVLVLFDKIALFDPWGLFHLRHYFEIPVDYSSLILRVNLGLIGCVFYVLFLSCIKSIRKASFKQHCGVNWIFRVMFALFTYCWVSIIVEIIVKVFLPVLFVGIISPIVILYFVWTMYQDPGFDLFITPNLVKIVAISGKIGSGKTTCCNYLVEKHKYVEINLADKLKQIVAELTCTPLDTVYKQKEHVVEGEFKLNAGKMREILQKHLRELYSLPRLMYYKFQLQFNNVIQSFANPPKIIQDSDEKEKDSDVPSLYDELIPDNAKLMSRGFSLGKILQVVGMSFRQQFDDQIWIKFLVHSIRTRARDGKCNFVVGDIRMKNEAKYFKKSWMHPFSLVATLIRIERKTENRLEFVKGRDQNHITEVDLDHYMGFSFVLVNDSTTKELFEKLLVLEKLVINRK